MKTEIVRNYLEILSIDNLVKVSRPSKSCDVKELSPPDFHLNKFFYKQIGKKYRWIDRLGWTDNQWISYTSDKNVITYILRDNNELVGFFEIILDKINKCCEIAYFGILEDYFNKKYGSYLLSEAIKKSFDLKVNRVWVHTCSLDHKNALNNYLSRGMKIFKKEKINLYIN